MAETPLYDLIIIGGGPGGLSAAIYAARAALKTLVIEVGALGGQITKSDAVENYPGMEHVTGAELSERFAAHALSYGIEILQDNVRELLPGLDVHRVRMEDGTEHRTLAVILATGGNPRKLGIPGEDTYYGRGVSYCAVCDGFFYKGKNVVVVGGGDSAAEEALFLAKIAKRVYMAHRRDRFRASAILAQRVMDDCNIEVLWNTVVTEVKADDAGVNAVVLDDASGGNPRDFPTEGLFIFIGFTPNNTLVPSGIKMNADGFVVTDEKCETNTPGIFVIGDLREKYARQIILAAADGCTAALAAAHFVEAKKALHPEMCEIPERPAS